VVNQDNDVLFEGELTPGQQQTFHATTLLQLRIGNPGAVDIHVNGRNLGPAGAMGEPVTRKYTATSSTQA
jgi:hypothetical protein